MTGRNLLALLLWAFLPAIVSAAPLPIYVLAGQSNMSGWGAVSELPDDAKAAQDGVFYHVSGGGFGLLRPTDDDFGPELEFGRTMAASLGGPLGIVKHAKGSTSLAVDWNPDGTDNLYSQLMTRVQNSRTFWTAAGYDVYVAGIVWMQGEEDARHSEMAAVYQANQLAFVEHIRSDLNAENAPFIFGQIRGSTFAYRDVIRDAQQSLDDAGIGAHLVGTDDLATYEGLHFTTAAQLTLGQRFATAMLGSRSEVPGDADGDGVVGIQDLNAVRNNFGGFGLGDVTRDGVITVEDLNVVRNNFGAGQFSPVPEPSSYVLAAIGLIGMAFVVRPSSARKSPA